MSLFIDEAEQEAPELPPLHPGNQPDVYVRCPYFPEHELRRSRLPYHILKCQKNPAAPKLLACPYNYLHRVRPEDKYEHLLICQDRVPVRYADRVPPSFGNTTKEAHVVSSPLNLKRNKLPQLPE